METGFSFYWWLAFTAAFIFIWCVDFWQKTPLSYKQPHRVAASWIALACFLALLIFATKGEKPALEFITGYLIEWSLSVDNLFVFMMIFHTFHVPAALQQKALSLGICGALVLRAFFILAGFLLLKRFSWIFFFFGVFLIISGIGMFKKSKKKPDFSKSASLTLLRRFFPIKEGWESESLFVRQQGTLHLTQFALVAVSLMFADVLFALDSIPAIFAITLDPFLVFSCNALAVMGLKSLFFFLQDLLKMFHYLHYAVCFILVFIGLKMCLQDFFVIPTLLSLGITLLSLCLAIVFSLRSR
jgi:tellurite resistance protein TerC